MSDKNTFKVLYGVDDGYAGGSRPHYTQIMASDIVDIDEDELENFYNECIDIDFRDKIYPFGMNYPEFLVWARGRRLEEP